MIVLQAKELSKSYGAKKIFEHVSFTIADGDKIGLIGPNGAGKTTLLRCLIGTDTHDSGDIFVSPKLRFGYLEQIPIYTKDTTLFESVLEVFADVFALRDKLRQLELAMSEVTDENLEGIMDDYAKVTEEYEGLGGFSCESLSRKITSGLSFTEKDLQRSINDFSGGEKTRAGLARLLVRQPELLLLDEPTNHLDLHAVEWLEDYLKSYQGTVLVISHDRYFLDEVTTRTLEMQFGELNSYPGNYSRYLLLKEEEILAKTKAFAKQQKMIQETEEYINKYRAGIKSKQARGRQSILERVQRLTSPKNTSSIKIANNKQDIRESGNVVLAVKELGFGFGTRTLFQRLSFEVLKGEKIGLIGGNGVGKSTILKILTGSLESQEGLAQMGSRVQVGYFDQEHSDLDSKKRVIDELIYNFGMSEFEARDILGSFLFREDDVFKIVGDLSGGEKGRLAFLKLFLSNANFLILDEPTNHLDIASKNIIEEYLADFPGTILVVSHDRYFLDKVINRTMEIVDGNLHNFLGNYTYFREKKKVAILAKQNVLKASESPVQKAQLNSKPKINKAKTRDEIASLEDKIENLEVRLQEVSELLADASSYSSEEQAKGLVNEYKQLEAEIPQVYSEWEELCEILANS